MRLGLLGWRVFWVVMMVEAHPKDPRVIEYKRRIGELGEVFEERRFKKQYKRAIREEIFGDEKRVRKSKRAAVQATKNKIKLEEFDPNEPLMSFVRRHEDLSIVRRREQRPRVVVLTTGKEFDYLEGTDDESLVLRRIWKYVNSRAYIRAVSTLLRSASLSPDSKLHRCKESKGADNPDNGQDKISCGKARKRLEG
ncbi:hypothetical protein AAMO2058_000265500 [Amorphochlora amoebiformis]